MNISDWIIVGVYMAAVLGMGFYFARRQKTTDAYFLAGRNIPGWAVGFSLMATMISSTTFIGHPANVFNSDMWALPMHAMLLIMMLFIARFVVRFYRRTVKLSAYGYLETRFGYPARAYGSFAFIVSRVMDVAGTFYFLSVTIAYLTGLDIKMVILVVGLVTLVFTLVGGVEAVVWTDVMQGILLVGGGLLLLGVVLFGSGVAPGALFAKAWEGGKFGMGDWRFSLRENNEWLFIVGGVIWALQRYGCDQHMVQRYLLARSDRDAVRGAYMGAAVCVPIWALFMLIGALVWACYEIGPQSMPADVRATADSIIPFFMKTHLPHGFIGLMLAALLSAAMSSLDADLNSLGSVVVDDFYGRLRPKATDRQRLWVGKLVVIVMGIAATVMSLQFVGIRSFIETTVSLFSWIAGGMLGLFVLGFCFRRATATGAYAGIAAGVLFTVWAAMTSVKLPNMDVPLLNLGAFNYTLTPYLIGVFTHMIVVGVGLTVSLVAGKPPADAERLTIWHREAP